MPKQYFAPEHTFWPPEDDEYIEDDDVMEEENEC